MFWTMFSHASDFSGTYLDNLGHGIFFGAVLLLMYMAVWASAALWNFVWSWIDEVPRKKYNCFSGFIAKITGYSYLGGLYKWESDKKGYTDFLHLIPMLILFSVPMVIITVFSFYEITLAIILAIALAHLTRYVLRMKKAFDKHVLDKDAHKGDK